MFVTRKFTFDSAHKLPDYQGKCKNLHGHTYRLEVTVQGEPDDKGMIMDFAVLKDIVKKNVLDIIDHSYLNDIIEQPTAENIVMWIWKKLEKEINLHELRLWETSDSSVSYMGD